MLVVADINTLWRSRPFEALAELTPVLGLAPQDRLAALRSYLLPWGTELCCRGRMETLRVVLPMRWASRRAEAALPVLWKAAQKTAAKLGQTVRGFVATSPHYLPLCRQLRGEVPVLYYCSDDYRSYGGWAAEEMEQNEGELVRMAAHSFFVSEELRLRAVAEYGVAESVTSVSMNATEDMFLTQAAGEQLAALMASEPRLKRPIVGVVGGVNDRLDFELLAQVSRLSSLGTLLFVGPVTKDARDKVAALVAGSSKVVKVGSQPHGLLPAWQQLLDVALIPYLACEFNRYCSPMRLFDHLAAGRPIIATSACPQVKSFKPDVTVADGSSFVASVAYALDQVPTRVSMRHRAKQETWNNRAASMCERLFAGIIRN